MKNYSQKSSKCVSHVVYLLRLKIYFCSCDIYM